MAKNYMIVSAILFALVALAQAARAVQHVGVMVGHHSVPLEASWFAAAVAGLMSFWAFRSARGR